MVLAVLYFGLVELLMIDSSRELAEARRFRSRIVAQTLAENGAELVAADITNPARGVLVGHASDWQGELDAKLMKDPNSGAFDIEASGTSKGLAPVSSKVFVRGRVVEVSPGRWDVRIQYTVHQP
jgi:hypothetical protein